MDSPNMLGVKGPQTLPQASHGVNRHQALHHASSPVNSPIKKPLMTKQIKKEPIASKLKEQPHSE